MVSLPNEGLPDLCASLETKYNIAAAWLETDLTREESVWEVRNWALENYRVDLLINNAGMGGTKQFDKASFDYLDKMLKLNVRATGLLTHLFLPELKTHREAFILNVASIIGYTPSAYKTFYPASKAFIFSFSRGLHEELKGTGVSVSVLMAGVMATNPSVVERMKAQGWRARFILVDTDFVAREALRRTFKRKPVIILGIGNKISHFLAKALPLSLRLQLMTNIISKEVKGEEERMRLEKNGKVNPGLDVEATAKSFRAPLGSK